MSASNSVTGKAVNLTVDEGTQVTMLEEGSISFANGESTNDFAPAAKAVTETFHETASPTIEFTTTIESETAGLEALGVIDDGSDGGTTINYSGSRRISDIKFEYLDADSGTVEWALNAPSATVEWSGVDGQNPPTMDFTLHLNEKPTIDNQTTSGA